MTIYTLVFERKLEGEHNTKGVNIYWFKITLKKTEST